MFPLNQRGQGGFTLVELLMALTIFAVLMAVGIPAMTNWVVKSKALSAGEFYMDGFSLARRQAVAHNAFSRIVLSQNTTNDQMDWQVDLCFATQTTPCSDVSGNWSTTSTQASGDPQGTAGFTSVFRAADTLPSADVLVPSMVPANSSTIYFSPLGWVNTTAANRMTRIQLDPAAKYAGEIPSVAVVVTLGGMASKCNPNVSTSDSRACPP